MLKFLALIMSIAAVVGLGMMIDEQSRHVLGPTAPLTAPATPVAQHTAQGPVIYAPGRIEGATPEIQLRPQTSGPVVALAVREGQWVEEGQLLLRLDSTTHHHQVALAAAELHLAEAQLERLVNGAHEQDRRQAAALLHAKEVELQQARLNLARTTQLRQADAVTQQRADEEKSLVESLTAEVEAAYAQLRLLESPARPDEVRISQARISAAKAQLDLAKAELEKTQLRAPCRGQILQLNVEQGEWASPTSEEPTLILADTSRYQVRAFVEELDAPAVRAGMMATIVADGLADQTFRGRVVRLSPRMGPKQLWSDRPSERYDTKTREVWVEIEGAGQLVVGLRVDVIIALNSPPPTSQEAASLAAAPKPIATPAREN